MDDRDLATLLREASRRVTPTADLDSVEQRREAGRRRRQRRDAFAAVVLSVAVIGGILGALRFQSHAVHAPVGDGSRKLATPPALLPGQFLYLKRAIVSDAGRIVTETWWASDNSGRIDFHCTIPDCGNVYGPPPT